MAKSCYISTGRFRKGRKLRKLRGATCRRTISVATARRCLSRRRSWLSLSMVPWQRTSLMESCERSFSNLVTAERNEKEEFFRKQRECKRGRLDDGDRGARFPKRRARQAVKASKFGGAGGCCKHALQMAKHRCHWFHVRGLPRSSSRFACKTGPCSSAGVLEVKMVEMSCSNASTSCGARGAAALGLEQGNFWSMEARKVCIDEGKVAK